MIARHLVYLHGGGKLEPNLTEASSTRRRDRNSAQPAGHLQPWSQNKSFGTKKQSSCFARLSHKSRCSRPRPASDKFNLGLVGIMPLIMIGESPFTLTRQFNYGNRLVGKHCMPTAASMQPNARFRACKPPSRPPPLRSGLTPRLNRCHPSERTPCWQVSRSKRVWCMLLLLLLEESGVMVSSPDRDILRTWIYTMDGPSFSILRCVLCVCVCVYMQGADTDTTASEGDGAYSPIRDWESSRCSAGPPAPRGAGT
ncbi:hypothetical protein LY76DRAFT_237631 [Colletotrichum caudatum]|nr:hypothetical protein LY76DRAFT_237631 [Colletotrichum caudatum]